MVISKPFAHPENYGPFNEMIHNNGLMSLYTGDINEVTYTSYYHCLINMMKDGIEHPFWHGKGKIRITFTDGKSCNLTLNDLYLNLIVWEALIKTGERIRSEHLFMPKTCSMVAVAKYLDKWVVLPKKRIYSNRYLNNVIASCTDKFADSDSVSFYMTDSICLHDDVALMNASPRYRELLHCDLSGIALDKVKDTLTGYTDEAVELIQASKGLLGYNHCLTSNFRTGEALNRKQFTETYIGLGVQADASGNIIPMNISESFINHGLEDIAVMYIESSRARKALIYSHKNVSTTGTFARLSKLSNMDTFLNPDPNYSCDTRNPVRMIIRDRKMLTKFIGRYYRRSKFGIEENITDESTDIIGQEIYLRSPMTCASFAAGHGICYRCYGDLAYTNSDINIGVMAAELLSSRLTQRLLSAKHLLETKIKKIIWSEAFNKFFYIDINKIILNPLDFRGYKMIIKREDLISDDYEEDEFDSDDDDDKEFSIIDTHTNYYLTEFIIESPSGEKFVIRSEDYDKMVTSDQLNGLIQRKLNKTADDENIVIDLSECEESMFTILVENSELTRTLGMIDRLINKSSVTTSMDVHQMVQAFNDTLMEANLDLCSVHAEVMIANQIISLRDQFAKPAWQYENEPYKIQAMSTHLENNPSVTISLSYQDVPRQLYGSKTYKKWACSQMDLFFMKNPQQFLESVPIAPSEYEKDSVDLFKFMKTTTETLDNNTGNSNSATVRITPFIIDG